MTFKKGSAVEVSSTSEQSAHCYYGATLLDVNDKKAIVMYDARWDIVENPVIEEVEISQIRPSPGLVVMDFSIGDVVNVLQNSEWWKWRVVADKGNYFKVFLSFLPPGNQHAWCHKSEMRVHCEWTPSDSGNVWTIKNAAFKKGAKIKVSGIGQQSVHCYYAATLLEIKDEKAMVLYDTRRDPSGNLVVEEVEIRQIRPNPGMVVMNLSVDDSVNVLEKAGWCKEKIVAANGNFFRVFLSFLPPDKQHAWCHKSDMRIHCEWAPTESGNIWTVKTV